MMPRAWTLVSRPAGMPTLEDFALVELPREPLGPGMLRVRNTWLSVDPYMRPRMNDVASYVPPYPLNDPLTGAAVGVVVESTAGGFAEGDRVVHALGWRDEAVGPADLFTRLPQDGYGDRLYLNTLGSIGATAYFGLFEVAQAKPGETAFISAAAGAVGSLAVQIAKARGLRVVGSAGGGEKCEVIRNLGADAAIDYKSGGSLTEKLRAAAPEGIDVYFDNVGGDHLDAALGCANRDARVAVCGMIDMYNSDAPVPLRNLFRVIAARIRIRGFIVGDFAARMPEFRDEMSVWLNSGQVTGLETIAHGLDHTPAAFLQLFSGGNTGKMLVEV